MSVKRAENLLLAACDRMATALEDALVEAVRQLSIRYPSRVITGCCAMGTFDIHASEKGWRAVGNPLGVELKHAVLEDLARIENDFGWCALPIVLVRAKGGLADVLHDWGAVAPVDWEALAAAAA